MLMMAKEVKLARSGCWRSPHPRPSPPISAPAGHSLCIADTDGKKWFGKNTVYGVYDVSECILIYQKYWFSSKISAMCSLPKPSPPEGLILRHQVLCTKMKTYINSCMLWEVFFYRKTSIPNERVCEQWSVFSEEWWIQSMSLGTLREMPHWAFVI